MNSWLIYLITTLVVLAILFGLDYIYKKDKTLKVTIGDASKVADNLLDVLDARMGEENKFDLYNKIAKVAVNYIEQLSQTKEMSSEDKKQTAMEYFIKTLGILNIPLDNNTKKVIEGCIESSVYFMNSVKSPINQ